MSEWIIIDNAHTAIVSEEIWNKANKIVNKPFLSPQGQRIKFIQLQILSIVPIVVSYKGVTQDQMVGFILNTVHVVTGVLDTRKY